MMKSLLFILFILSCNFCCAPSADLDSGQIMTVTGMISAKDMGLTLEHEHITTDFIGAEKVKQPQYPVNQAAEKIVPYLTELKKAGVQTLIECTPEYIGRDVLLLKELSLQTGLNILTNTGYYAAVDKKYLPHFVYTETAQQLADRWKAEWENGIGNTDIKPGFIKLGVGNVGLDSIEQKIIKAGALTHLATGLKIAVHTGSAKAANDEIDILENTGVDARALIVVHGQNTKIEEGISLIKRGCWLSLDGINQDPEVIQKYRDYLIALKNENMLDQVLISHDNGWAVVQQADGSITFELFGTKDEKPFLSIFTTLIPELREAGFTEKDINQLLITNPAQAFRIEVCRS